ncbi:hypothetical protein VTL71DRAFT_14140 [Oculimacula yallundae]|uniref:Major facilitator superfamily (MFS) profile domain-containing protein n=1 Tax=Oculimacula yallundae TaxID=86028 RepID=A0ABR4CHL6_9HELO
MGPELWRKVPGHALLWALNLFSAVALIFEGYNQGVMGFVNSVPGYIDTVDIGSDGVITNTTKQGGLVAIYYFGAIFGCFVGGRLGDKYGRKKAVVIGSILTLIGAALQAGSQSSNMSLVARVISGLGIGFINSIIPAWVSELARAHNRGSSFALVFCANYVGIAIAYWLGYGLRFHTTDFRWRFPLAFQAIPSLILLCTVWFLPESPRWLISHGRRQEAVDILAKIRGDVPLDDPELVQELQQLDATVISSKHKRYQFHNVTFGRYSGRLHIGRRVCLAIGIMLMMEWTGILAITVYANTLFQTAGFTQEKAAWLSGLCNSIGILGTLASVFTVDRFGRRASLFFGFFIQGAALFLSAGLGRLGELNPNNSGAYGAAAAAMVFIYTFFFAQTVLMIAFIYPTEIWPQEIRAFGNSYGVFGWAVGCGVTTLVIPSMFAALQWKTLIVFGAFNFASLPLVYFFFPETNGRSLEEINLLFAASSPFVKANEKEFAAMLAAAGGNVAEAERALVNEVDRSAGEWSRADEEWQSEDKAVESLQSK